MTKRSQFVLSMRSYREAV